MTPACLTGPKTAGRDYADKLPAEGVAVEQSKSS